MNGIIVSPWTDARVAFLRERWANNASAAAIARELNCGLTKNSVIGKIHRLGLSVPSSKPDVWSPEDDAVLVESWGRGDLVREIAYQVGRSENAVKRRAYRLKLANRRTSSDRAMAGAVAKAIIRAHNRATAVFVRPKTEEQVKSALQPRKSGGISLFELTENTCRFPLGNPGEPGFHFCGDAPEAPLPYCRMHARISYYRGAR